MNKTIEEHMLKLDKMNRMEKLEYCFINFYECYKNNNELKDVFFLIIANLFTDYPIKEEMKVNGIKNSDKAFIIDCAYEYAYENVKSLRGPLLNTFGEILDSDTPSIEPYLDLMRMITYNKVMKK